MTTPSRFILDPATYHRTPVYNAQPDPKTIPGTATLRLYDPIDSYGGDWGVSAKEFTAALDQLPKDTTDVQLLINSPGGMVWEALAILNALRAHPARVTAVVEGLAASAASFIAAGVDQLNVMQNAELMVHKAMGLGLGNAADLTKLASDLDHEDRNLAAIYAAKSGGTVDEWLAVMEAETWFSAEEAVATGLADKVIDPPKQEAAASPKARFDYSIFNYAGRAAAPTPTIPSHTARTIDTLPAGQGRTEREGAVADYAKLREAFGLDPATSDDEVTAAMRALVPVESAPAVANVAPAVDVEEQPARPVISADTPGALVISTSVWEESQNTIKELSAFVAKTKLDERDSILTQAVKDGKFRPTQLDDFKKEWDKNPDGIRNLVAKMTPNSALAVAAAGYAADVSDDAMDAEFAGLFPPSGRG